MAVMYTTDIIKELEEARARVASMEKTLEAELHKELAALPARYGFGSVADFFAAVTKAVGTRRGRKPGKAMAAVAPVAAVKPEAAAKLEMDDKAKRRMRAIITAEIRAERSRRSAAGMEAARRRGTRFGRPPLDPKIVRLIHATAARMGRHVRAIAREIHVSPSTVCRVLARGRKGAGRRNV
jgi:hypothetical protein